MRSIRSPAKPSSAGSNVSDADDGDRDDRRRTDRQTLDELHAHEQQAHQRDDDGGAGEQHRTTRGVDGDADRLAHRVTGVQLLAIAGDDEQRVVDADAEADHDAEERREVGDGKDVASGA